MKREIKFRIWDGIKIIQQDDRRMFDKVVLEKYPVPQYINITSALTHGLPVMQYIGLKDKTGKEVYEGDILHIELYGKVIIIWNDSICAFQYAYDAIGRGTSIGGRMTNTLYDHDVNKKYNVIGNIYEHPELLEPNAAKL